MSPAYLCRQIRVPDSVLPIDKSLWPASSLRARLDWRGRWSEARHEGDDGGGDRRRVGAEAAEGDGEAFEGRMRRLTVTLCEQQAEAAKLEAALVAHLQELGYDG